MDGMTLEKLQVLIEAQTKGFKDEVAKVQNEVKRMTKNVNNEVNKVKSINVWADRVRANSYSYENKIAK